jgi:pimeloyl-ACP methyl ester carboxylesterase
MCGYRKKIRDSYAELNKIDSKIFASSLGDIEYLLKGEGTTILISHGVSGGVDQGIGLTNSFFNKKYQFLFLSRFGYLKSAIPDNPSAEMQADAFKELLEELNLEKVVLYANSAGSTSVIQFAIKYPQNCLGLILQSANAPLGYKPGTPPKFIFKSNFLYWFFLKLFGKMMFSMFVPKTILKNLNRQEKNQLMDDVFFSVLPITARTKGALFDTSVSNPSIEKDVPFEKIKSPTLILNAIDDPATKISGARTLAEKVPNSKLVEFETGGHLLYNQDKKVKEEIDRFLKDL